MTANNGDDDTKKIEAVAERLAFFFSDSNLRHDKFLSREVSKVETDGFVPIQTLLKFKTIKNISLDEKIIAAAAKHDSVKDLVKLNEKESAIGRVERFNMEKLTDRRKITLFVENLPLIFEDNVAKKNAKDNDVKMNNKDAEDEGKKSNDDANEAKKDIKEEDVKKENKDDEDEGKKSKDVEMENKDTDAGDEGKKSKDDDDEAKKDIKEDDVKMEDKDDGAEGNKVDNSKDKEDNNKDGVEGDKKDDNGKDKENGSKNGGESRKKDGDFKRRGTPKRYAVSFDDVTNLFNKYGKVSYVKLRYWNPRNFSKNDEEKSKWEMYTNPRNRGNSPVPLGSGFVEFASEEEMCKAAKALIAEDDEKDPPTFLELGGRKLRVMTMQGWIDEKEKRKSRKNAEKDKTQLSGKKHSRDENGDGDDEKEGQAPKGKEEEKNLPKFEYDWKKGCVISVKGLPADCRREDIRDTIMKHLGLTDMKTSGIYADFSMGQTDGAVRFNEPSDDIAVIAKMLDGGELQIGGSKIESAKLLEGEEEEAYWKNFIDFKTKQMRHQAEEKARKRARSGRRGGGRGGRGGGGRGRRW